MRYASNIRICVRSAPMADVRRCDQCGTLFVPPREHARFCSAGCRIAWNRENASSLPVEDGALDWSVTAMRETTERLLRARGWQQPHAFAVISEAVWWVTMVDAALVRYHPGTYAAVLAAQDEAGRQVTETTLRGLRFVRNWMGYHADHADFIQQYSSQRSSGSDLIARWVWRPQPVPSLTRLSARGQEWEMERYRAYQAQLANHPIGQTFKNASAFLQLATGSSREPLQASQPAD